MPVYAVTELDVSDPDGMKKFGEQADKLVKAQGGKFLVRPRGKIEAKVGEAPKHLVIIQWESLEKAQAYYQSEEYKRISPIRDKATTKTRIFIADGADEHA